MSNRVKSRNPSRAHPDERKSESFLSIGGRVNWNKRKKLGLLIAILLISSIGAYELFSSLGYQLQISHPSPSGGTSSCTPTNPQGCPTIPLSGCTWSIYYAEGTSNVLGVNPTATAFYSNANFTIVWDSVINAINGGGGTVCIGAGTFIIDTSVNLAGSQITSTNPWNNFELRGVAQGASILKLVPGNYRPILDYRGTVTNFTVTRMVFDGNQANEADSSTAVLFNLQSASNYNLNFYYDIFRDCRNNACLQLNGESMDLISSQFLNSGITGGASLPSGVIFYLQAQQVWSVGNFFSNIQGAGVLVYHCYYCTFGNNGFDENALGTKADFYALASFLWSTIVDNSFTHSLSDRGQELNVSSGAYLSITGNSFSTNISPGASTVITLGGTQTVFSGNSIQDFGAGTNIDYLVAGPSFVGTISGNSFGVNSAVTSIIEITGARVAIDGNSFTGPAVNAIDLESLASTNITITDNQFITGSSQIKFGVAPTGQTIIRNNAGYNPVGQITNFITSSTIAPWGTSSTVSASTDYTVKGVDTFLTSTGGTAISITVKDSSGNTVTGLSGLATVTAQYLPIGYRINFGAFSGAPNVTVF
jgi:hypothetical protein